MDIVNFNKPPAIYWSTKLKVEWLQRYIIIHSILYYELHESIIEDFQFDQAGKQLLELQEELTKKEFMETEYYYVFKDFDASTGFYIYDRLIPYDKMYLKCCAKFILSVYKKGGYGNGY